MLLLFDQIKTPHRRIQMISLIMPQKVYHPPPPSSPPKIINQRERKETMKNPVVIILVRLIWHVWRRQPKMTMVCLMVILCLFNNVYASL